MAGCISGVGGAGPAGPAGAAGPAGPAGPAGGNEYPNPDWAWVDLPTTEGGAVDFDLADWSQATPGALSPVTLTPTLAADSKSILLDCPAGYGAFLRPQAMADGEDVCFVAQVLVASPTSLSTNLNLQAQVAAFESAAAATLWGGVGARWPSSPVWFANVEIGARIGLGASIQTDNSFGATTSASGALLSNPFAVRFRRSGATLQMFIAEYKSGWKFAGTPTEAQLDAALAGLHVGIRWRSDAGPAGRVIIHRYYAGAAVA
jgi:hypothetical protein